MNPNKKIEEVIQGGMGVHISSPFLAKIVSCCGGLGTVTGVAPERIMVRILQRGDPGGHYRRALAQFPFQDFAKRILDAFYIEEGKSHNVAPRAVPVYNINPSPMLISLIVCANFAFVYLAKEGHDNPISINYLEKIAMPHIYAITGAMMAGVDVITMGAGIPRHIPEVINALIENRTVRYSIPVIGMNIKEYIMSFDPEKFFGSKLPTMRKPKFIPIIASNVLATVFAKKLPAGSIYGFVVEEPTAGGHNAPPRKLILDENQEPIYGIKDYVNYGELADLGYPFWIGGSYASREKLKWAKSQGAVGIQVGSIFALCDQSGMDPELRRQIKKLGYKGALNVRTSMSASPTGYPFKVAVIPKTLSEATVYAARKRICNQGALVNLYEKPDGKIGYRCSAEPEVNYLRKGGKIEDTSESRCICNGLISTAGLGDEDEPPIITIGNDVSFLPLLMRHEDDSYNVSDVFDFFLG